MHVNGLSGLPPAALVAIVVLIAVQLGLQVWGLIDLAMREQVLGGRKWVWLLVILLGELVGVIVYLAIGRSATAEAADPLASAPASGGRVEHAADVLYGKQR